MAIDYVEVRDSTREVIGIVDTFGSIIWHTVWFGVGDFEIYAVASEQNLELLQKNNYVTRSDDEEVGIIEKVVINEDASTGRMITATGRFAKSILNRRLIYNLSGTSNKATVLHGLVEVAARTLVANNAINCSFDVKRNIPILELGTLKNFTEKIVDEKGSSAYKQVSYDNLLDYTDSLLQEYNLSAKIILDDDTKKLQYVVEKGTDRSESNSNGIDPVIFSKDYDNITDSEYSYSTENKKNVALIGGEGEGLARFYALLDPVVSGLERKEIFVDASSISKSYQDEQEQEQTYTDAEYTAMLKTQGKQTLKPLTDVESFEGTITVTSGNYILNRDFYLGDIVTVQENSIDKFIDVRITEVTEVQDENGYTVDAVYE